MLTIGIGLALDNADRHGLALDNVEQALAWHWIMSTRHWSMLTVGIGLALDNADQAWPGIG